MNKKNSHKTGSQRKKRLGDVSMRDSGVSSGGQQPGQDARGKKWSMVQKKRQIAAKKLGRLASGVGEISLHPVSQSPRQPGKQSQAASQRPQRPSLLDLIEEMKRGDVKDQERTLEALKDVERTRI